MNSPQKKQMKIKSLFVEERRSADDAEILNFLFAFFYGW